MILVDFKKLNTFMAIVREKSFSKAAEYLGMSQPAVTQEIKLLEERFQTPLFVRSRRGIYLTPKGEKIYTILITLEGHITKADRMLKERFVCAPLHKRIHRW